MCQHNRKTYDYGWSLLIYDSKLLFLRSISFMFCIKRIPLDFYLCFLPQCGVDVDGKVTDPFENDV